MNEEDLADFGLSREVVLRTARFHRRYADAVAAEQAEDEYLRVAEAATAYREAAQWELLNAPARAVDPMWRAGSLYARIGHAYGDYLSAVASGERMDSAVRRPIAGNDDVEYDVVRIRNPQQSAYQWLIDAAQSRSYTRQNPDGPHLEEQVALVGALGIPVRRYWQLAQALHGSWETAARTVAEALTATARRYSEVMELASTNEYLWRNGAAPVDIGDLDLAGMATLTARRFGAEQVRAAVLRAGEVPYRGLLIIEAGFELAELA
ncbi:hypothetical protein V5P93_002264 [Actinokineospora auranticolor]|uniref:Uncharacterized protein n=1 Tax=Actinokineospora auranticolor TaxID=155976 RepID=A0A2S6GDG3_9PSEU|nr:hypothetical protein [Actinokineospora auranticolor]PPK63294.1 hypothetical protein CLV40_1297 [Actinokineospora auranticolor]